MEVCLVSLAGWVLSFALTTQVILYKEADLVMRMQVFYPLILEFPNKFLEKKKDGEIPYNDNICIFHHCDMVSGL